jgi:hypothetical protein
MAVIEIGEGILHGKQGPITFVYRKGVNFTRVTVTPKNPRSPAQQAHRALFGQLMSLGAIWNRDFITPYFQGDLTTQTPYPRFIKYNWRHWGKTLPAWREALPFWGLPRSVPFGAVPFPGDTGDVIPLKILAHIGDLAAFPNAELYGFYTDAQPEDYYKLRPQPIAQAAWQPLTPA